MSHQLTKEDFDVLRNHKAEQIIISSGSKMITVCTFFMKSGTTSKFVPITEIRVYINQYNRKLYRVFNTLDEAITEYNS